MHKPEITTKARFALAASALATSLLSGPVQAKCPDGDPCERLNVYRLQTWPTVAVDAAGVSLLELKEANASDAAAFKDILSGVDEATSQLAIRFNVSWLPFSPNGYCECNLEMHRGDGASTNNNDSNRPIRNNNNINAVNAANNDGQAGITADKGCGPKMPFEQLKSCRRVCEAGKGRACQNAGIVTKSSGHWYSFPKLLEKTDGDGRNWAKSVFEKKNVAEWQVNRTVIKNAGCIARELRKAAQEEKKSSASASVESQLDQLFTSETPCATLSAAEVLKTQRTR
jgi:hypothetical protein